LPGAQQTKHHSSARSSLVPPGAMQAAVLLVAAAGFMVSGPTKTSSPRPAHSLAPPIVQLASAKPVINPSSSSPTEGKQEQLQRPRFDMQRLLIGALNWGLSCRASAEDLLLACVSPETFGMLREWRKQAFGEEAHLAELLQQSKGHLLGSLDSTLGAHISVRTKGLWSTFHKVCVRDQRVHDTLALRIVVDGDDDSCMGALQAVREFWPSAEGRFKNYIVAPKLNGYRALHDTVLLPCGTPLEVQVRTREMHRHAELGAASHRNYKGPLEELPGLLLGGMTSLRLPELLPAPRPAFSFGFLG